MTEELKAGDSVVLKKGRGGPWIIMSIGSQPSLFDVGWEKVAVFEDGSFIGVDKLKKVKS